LPIPAGRSRASMGTRPNTRYLAPFQKTVNPLGRPPPPYSLRHPEALRRFLQLTIHWLQTARPGNVYNTREQDFTAPSRVSNPRTPSTWTTAQCP
jgi:hypothetical protein